MSFFRPLILLLILSFTVSCGFRPLQGQYSGADISADLASIQIKPIADRTGQRLRNQLMEMFAPFGRMPEARYILEVQLSEGVSHLAVQKSSFATRANLYMSASFSLKESGTHKVLFTGSSKIVSSYNILSSEFGTFMAENDSRISASRKLGEEIGTRLSVFFTQQSKETGAP